MLAYQQLENYLIAPRVTARTMAIHPAVTIGALIAGASLLGGAGAVLALPVAATIQALISTTVQRHQVIEAEAVAEEPGRTAGAGRGFEGRPGSEAGTRPSRWRRDQRGHECRRAFLLKLNPPGNPV